MRCYRLRSSRLRVRRETSAPRLGLQPQCALLLDDVGCLAHVPGIEPIRAPDGKSCARNGPCPPVQAPTPRLAAKADFFAAQLPRRCVLTPYPELGAPQPASPHRSTAPIAPGCRSETTVAEPPEPFEA